MRKKIFILLQVFFYSATLLAKVTIVANPDKFGSIEKAAFSEDKVNFWDDDFTDDRACTECFAAVELKKFLVKVTELKASDITFATPENLPKTGDVFILGSKVSNSILADSKTKFKSDQSFKITTEKQKSRIITTIEGSDRMGTIYGTYRYLNKLGIHFYGLGETGTVYPETPVSLIQELNILENPSYLVRGFWVWGDRDCSEDFFLWMLRNRMNLWTSENQPVPMLKKFGMLLADGGHEMHAACLNPRGEYPYNHPKFTGDESKPADPYKVDTEYTGDTNNDGKLTYFEAHPQWYGLHDGKRSDHIPEWQGDNFCTSNADARKELAKNFVKDVINGVKSKTDIVRIGMLDCGRWCECENCKKSGNYSYRLFSILDAILKEVKKARQAGALKRKIRLEVYAYSETITPPNRPLPEDFDYDNCSVGFFPVERCYYHSFADPTCSEINAPQVKAYLGWVTGQGRNYKGTTSVGEYYNISSLKSLPTLYTKLISTDIPWYYSTGARQFCYMHTLSKLWGTWTLTQNLLSDILWNVDLDANKFLDDYFSSYYPTTKEDTRKFYDHLEVAMAQTKSFKHFSKTTKGPFSFRSWTGLITGEKKNVFPFDHMKYEKYTPLTNDGPDMVEIIDNMRLARKYIDSALINCSNEKEQARLIEDERRFAYGESMINFFYHLVRIAMFHNKENTQMAKHEFTLVKKYADELKQIEELVQCAYVDPNDDKNGFIATQMTDVYDLYEERYGK